MKKITSITAIAFLAIAVISCSKTSSGYLPSPSSSQSATNQQPVKVRIISNWETLSMVATSVNGVSQLEGQSMLSQIVSYEAGMHKKLAYLKTMGRDGATYKALPTNYSTVDGSHSFNFSLDFSTFKVSISNTDFPIRQVNALNFSDFKYRYIVIPVEVYQSFQINWDDLPSVASALGFSL